MKLDWKFWIALFLLNVVSGVVIWRVAKQLGYTKPAT